LILFIAICFASLGMVCNALECVPAFCSVENFVLYTDCIAKKYYNIAIFDGFKRTYCIKWFVCQYLKVDIACKLLPSKLWTTIAFSSPDIQCLVIFILF